MTDQPVTPPVSDAPTETDSGKTTENAFDPSKLSQEDFAKVFEDERLWKHDRFKQLNAKAKKAEELEKTIQEQKTKDLEKNKEWEKLAEERRIELEKVQTQYQSEKIANAIQIEATKQGAVDVDTVLKLIDRDSITITENGVEGVAEAVTKLLEAKKFLAGSNNTSVGNGTNPPNTDGTAPKRFKASQLNDVKFFRENEEDINTALRLGLIQNDLS